LRENPNGFNMLAHSYAVYRQTGHWQNLTSPSPTNSNQNPNLSPNSQNNPVNNNVSNNNNNGTNNFSSCLLAVGQGGWK
jgi:hypothetical protein